MTKWTLALAAVFSVWTGVASAQTPPAGNAALRQQIERRFDVLVLSDRLVLRPRTGSAGVKVIEVIDRAIALDGTPATGAEVKEKLGSDAGAVLELSYLSATDQRALFQPTPPVQPTAPAAPATPEPPAPVTAPTLPEPPAGPTPPVRDRRRRGDVVRFGGDIRIDANEQVNGNVVAILGDVRIDGEVRGEVVSVGGSVELGPQSVVTEDVAVIGGRFQRDEGARVLGRLHEVGVGEIDFGDVGWNWNFGFPRPFRALALMSTLGRVAVLSVLAILVMLLGREYVERTSDRAAAEPLKAGAIGFLAQLLFIPVLVVTCVVLIITIIGIPLLLLIPFAVLAMGLLALLGFTGVAYRIGLAASSRLGWNLSGYYLPVILGVVIVVSPLLVARLLSIVGGPFVPLAVGLGIIAFIVEWVTWTIGFGAVALARFDRPRYPSPPVAATPPVLP
jgi:hypothetical protein